VAEVGQPISPYSHVVVDGDYAFLSGQIEIDCIARCRS
jgi:enamine deaminase RidA (YjgF/YER057c/UK114 family)